MFIISRRLSSDNYSTNYTELRTLSKREEVDIGSMQSVLFMLSCLENRFVLD